MILAGVAIAVLCTLANLAYLRATLAQMLRWRMYALRDDLRWLAIKNPDVRGRRAFVLLDRKLTAGCTSWEEIDIWTLVIAVWLLPPGDPNAADVAALREDLALAKNVDLKRIHDESLLVGLQQAALGHPVTVALLGAIALVLFGRGRLMRAFDDLTSKRRTNGGAAPA